MEKNILISMLGNNDCKLPEKIGSIISIVNESKKKIDIEFDKVIVLVDELATISKNTKKYSDSIPGIKKYFERNHPKIELQFEDISFKNPIEYAVVYPIMYNFISNLKKNYSKEKYFISITSGTSTMSASWILLVKSAYISATILQTSPQKGLNIVDLEIADFPEIKKLEDAKLKIKQLSNENKYLRNLNLNIEIPEIVGRSPKIIEVKKQIEFLAKYDIPIMILGETGTGKELVAKALHDYSNRRNEKFIAVNCGAISENLVESELFGYVKGAFSGAMQETKGVFEKVGAGTLFLDEIGDLPLFMQVKLLRVLNEKKFSKVGDIGKTLKSNARIVAATNKNLWELMKEGKFREDLFFRLTDEIIKLPSLNERQYDIEDIANYILEKMNNQYNKNLKFSNEAISLLKTYEWPGNIRELGQVVRRAFIYSENIILKENIRFIPSKLENDKNEIKIPINGLNFEKDIEIKYYERALEIANGNITKAAKLLSLEMHTFRKRLESKKISVGKFKNRNIDR